MDTTKKTMVVFSGDLDKALAAFVIANGAAAMGDEVTMFFTFWGLNIIRKPKQAKAARTALQRMFGMMMPSGPAKLPLSKMNFAGMGRVMMRKAMKHANVSTLEELIEIAREQEIKMIACTMSMDVMGITKDDLIDGVDFAGVAAYLGDADEANVNLFI